MVVESKACASTVEMFLNAHNVAMVVAKIVVFHSLVAATFFVEAMTQTRRLSRALTSTLQRIFHVATMDVFFQMIVASVMERVILSSTFLLQRCSFHRPQQCQ